MEKRKYSVGIWAYGNCCDRFCEEGYQETRSFSQKLELASKTKGLDGIEIHYNGDFNESNLKEIKKIIDDSGLKVAAINCNTFGSREFAKGALTNRNEKIRNKAIDIVKKAGEMTEYFESSIVNLWPGADGFDYSFQIDYLKEFDLIIDALTTAADANPKVKYSIEYKLREPRIRSTIGTVGKTISLINEAKRDNLGVTVDFGHSLQSRENPAEAAVFANRYNKLFHIHLNDNARDWDDDLIFGSYHIWETLEFIYYLNKLNYKGWIGFDMSPAREEQVSAVEYCISTCEKFFNYVNSFDESELENAFKATDALRSQRYLSKILFR